MKTLRIPYDQISRIELFLKKEDLKPREIENVLWSYTDGHTFFNMYSSGILLIQGKNTDEWVKKTLDEISAPEKPVVGCDEAGKGEIFGPLVLCCAVIPPENFKKVLSLAPKDSKRMKEEELAKKIRLLKPLVKLRCISIDPSRFNTLYEEVGNINKIMDAAYRKLIDTVVKEFHPSRVVIDAYQGVNPFQDLESVIFEKKSEDKYVETSIAGMFARYKYLKSLRALEEELRTEIPRGAGQEAKDLAKRLVEAESERAFKAIKKSFNLE